MAPLRDVVRGPIAKDVRRRPWAQPTRPAIAKTPLGAKVYLPPAGSIARALLSGKV